MNTSTIMSKIHEKSKGKKKGAQIYNGLVVRAMTQQMLEGLYEIVSTKQVHLEELSDKGHNGQLDGFDFVLHLIYYSSKLIQLLLKRDIVYVNASTN